MADSTLGGSKIGRTQRCEPHLLLNKSFQGAPSGAPLLPVQSVSPGAEERAIAHEERVCSLTFHPDPGVPIVAAGAVNGKIRLVNTTGGAETVARGEEVATSATWNAAGDALAVGCEGGTLRILFFKSEEKAKREVIKKEREVGQGCEAKLRWSDELLSREHLQVMI